MDAPFFYDLLVVERNVLHKARFLKQITYPLPEEPHIVNALTSRRVARKHLIENAVLWVQNNFKFQTYRMGDIYRRVWAKYRELNEEYLDARLPAFPSQKFWVCLDVLIGIANNHLKSHAPRTYNVKMKDSQEEYYILFPEGANFDYTIVVQDGDCPSVEWILDMDELEYIRLSCGDKELILEVDEESDTRYEEINLLYQCFECSSFRNVDEHHLPWHFDPESRRNTGSSSPVFSITLCRDCYNKTKGCGMLHGHTWFDVYEHLRNTYWGGTKSIYDFYYGYD